jgi:succinate dehydrogenase / fumarate reductase flavoprotein subunit
MKDVMFSDVGVYRNGSAMEGAIDGIMELKEKYKHVRVSDTGKVFNTELLNAWELGNLLDIAEVVAMCALNRTESRGGHSREDYPERDDENWLKHTLITMKNGKLEITYKPVVITKYEPKARVY